ncbi:MAG: hypothetical protein E7260_12985 [Lachnospiraceae bacterium]|nr:hypothetical protein [Lachnospiraceae bacterium]
MSKKETMKNSIKRITINGIGVALFVVLSLCLQVPVFENYYLCLGYVVMAVYCYSAGILSGTFVGTAGVILYCIIINGLRGMPGWSIGNIAIGLMIGTAFLLARKVRQTALSMGIIVVGIVLACAVGILGIKSLTEVILYTQPFMVRVASNMSAFVADVIVLLVAVPVCKMLDPHVKKILD